MAARIDVGRYRQTASSGSFVREWHVAISGSIGKRMGNRPPLLAFY
jgi:hypothetical protein